MFERYTEKARRAIFFARYEASQFGSPCIETEHLLLGLLRENKVIAYKLLKRGVSTESFRQAIAEHTAVATKMSTSVDLPLSNECKRVLAYAAEEAERLSHKHIGTEHLFLGLLREKKGFAAHLLIEAGATLEEARNQIATWPAEPGFAIAPSGRQASIHGHSLPLEYVTAKAVQLSKFAWIRRDWKPIDVVVDNERGGICFDLAVKDDTRFKFVSGGWNKEPCAICGWELSAEGGPERSEAFTNGRQWLCAECYHRFVAKNSAGAA
jgi:hypothetical protein